MKVELLLAFQFRGKTFPRFFRRWRGQDDEINASSAQKSPGLGKSLPLLISRKFLKEPPSTFRGFIFPSFLGPNN